MKFLVDEDLSPLLVEKLHQRGHEAQKVNHIGLTSHADHLVWAHAYANNQVVVTANAADFFKLAKESELHAGLIILRSGQLLRQEQWAWLLPVVEALEERGGDGMLNEYVEIFGVGDFTWPPDPLPADTEGGAS